MNAARERRFDSVESIFTAGLNNDFLNNRPRPQNTEDTPKEETPKPAAPAKTPTPPQEPAPKPDTEPATLADRAVQLSMPLSLANRFRNTCKEQHLSQPELVFSAIEATLSELPELLRNRTQSANQLTATPLFDRPITTAKTITEEPRETIVIRVTAHNRDILNDLVKQVGAPNRNVLLTTALDHFLP